jgi:ribonuclease P protein subunit RPR2
VKRGKPRWQQKIARERIEILFKLAEEWVDSHPERSRRCIELARKIGLRYNIRFPKELKRKFCKNCNTLLIPGKTSSIRVSKKNLIVKCLNCNKIYKYPTAKK